jgi:hypothetical protein
MLPMLFRLIVAVWLAFAIGAISGCAVATTKLPIREIDRPISAPAGIKQVRVDLSYLTNSGFGLAPGGAGGLAPIGAGPSLTPDFSYAVTDGVSFVHLPYPVIVFRIFGRDAIDNDTVKAAGFSMAGIGGVTGSYPFEWHSTSFDPTLGVVGKAVLSRTTWLSFDARVIAFRGQNFIGEVGARAGHQRGRINSFSLGVIASGWDATDTKLLADSSTFFRTARGIQVAIPLSWQINWSDYASIDLDLWPMVTYAGGKETGAAAGGSVGITFLW